MIGTNQTESNIRCRIKWIGIVLFHYIIRRNSIRNFTDSSPCFVEVPIIKPYYRLCTISAINLKLMNIGQVFSAIGKMTQRYINTNPLTRCYWQGIEYFTCALIDNKEIQSRSIWCPEVHMKIIVSRNILRNTAVSAAKICTLVIKHVIF